VKAILWGYSYNDMKKSWSKQMCWLAEALRQNGCEIIKKDMKCDGLEAREYDCKKDNPCDIAVYNHIDISNLTGNVVKADHSWFFKPTVPDDVHTTLDPIGYGPFSSVSFDKPDFESVNSAKVKTFYETKVKDWVEKGTTKWGSFSEKPDIDFIDYWLVLGQCGGDSVNTRHDFGDYFTKLKQVVTELARIDERQIIVKLHPYTDGKDATDTIFSDNLAKQISAISPKVKVYTGKIGIHSLIENCRAVILGNSGAGYEAMMHHKPIIAWGKPEYKWIAYDLQYLADMVRAIKLDWFDADKQDKFLYWHLEKYCYYDQETCNRRVKELLAEKEWNFDELWKNHRPAQGYTEFKKFIDIMSNKLLNKEIKEDIFNGPSGPTGPTGPGPCPIGSTGPEPPVVLEIGLRRGDQRYFYKNLFNADYRGIDITKFDFPEFIHGDSGDPNTLKKVKKWLKGRKIDLLFIDGDHKYEPCKRDYEMYGPLSKIIVFHDIVTKNSYNDGVPKLWKEIKTKDCIEIIKAEGSYGGDGIGILENKCL